METLKTTTANLSKIDRLRSHLDVLLTEALKRGFHGSVRVELIVSDGTIQHVSRTIERVDK